VARPKIYYNVQKSKYCLETPTLIFYFSSSLYLEKFFSTYEENRLEQEYKFTSRYNIPFNITDYFDIILYSSIEKRGFYVVIKKGGELSCLNEIILDGEIKTKKNYSA